MGSKISAAVVVMFFISAIAYDYHTRKPLVEVEKFDKAPADAIRIGASILPDHKLNKSYRFIFTSNEGEKLDHKEYLAKHPEDAVIKLTTLTPEQALIVFSDRMPDEEFFRTKEK